MRHFTHPNHTSLDSLTTRLNEMACGGFLLIASVQLSGPTIFSQVLDTAHAITMDGSQYFVLLILTDGEITDMDNTRDRMVQNVRFSNIHINCRCR